MTVTDILAFSRFFRVRSPTVNYSITGLSSSPSPPFSSSLFFSVEAKATNFWVLRSDIPGVKIARAPLTSTWVNDFLSAVPLLESERRKLLNSPNYTIRPARSSMSRMKLRLSNTAFTSALETVERTPIIIHNVSMSV